MTKYGNEARKILCLLQNGEYYEPHVIARLCLLDEKDAKRVLYRVVWAVVSAVPGATLEQRRILFSAESGASGGPVLLVKVAKQVHFVHCKH